MKILYLLASLLLLAEVYGDMELDDDDDNYDDDNINGTLLTHNLDFDDALFDKDQAFEFDWKYFEWQFIEFKITIPSETKTFCAPELVLLDQCFDEDKKPLQAKKLTKCMADIYSKMEEGGKKCDNGYFPCQNLKKCSDFFEGCYVQVLNLESCLVGKDFTCDFKCNHKSWMDVDGCLDQVKKFCTCGLLVNGSFCFQRVMRERCGIPARKEHRIMFRAKLRARWIKTCRGLGFSA